MMKSARSNTEIGEINSGKHKPFQLCKWLRTNKPENTYDNYQHKNIGGVIDTKAAKKFSFDVGWVLVNSMVVLLLHFLQKPIVARYLGPDGLGLYSMVTMIAGIIVLIAGMGIDSAVVKYVAEYKDDKNRLHALFSSAFITVAIFGVTASIVLFVLSDKFASIFDMSSLSPLLKIYAFVFPFSLTYGIILGVLNGLREMKYYSFIKTLYSILMFLFILTFLFLGFGVKGAVIGDMLALIVATLIVGIIIKKFVHFAISDYRKNTKMLTSFGSRLVGAGMIGQIYHYIDILMIGYFLTSTEVGHYAVAMSLSRFFWLVPRAMATVAYPTISECWAKNDIQAINKLVDKSTKYCACILVFAGMSVIFFAKDIIIFLFTPEFLPAVLPLTILIIGTVTSGILRPITVIFASTGKVNLVLIISAIGAVGDILLNIALIPTYGIIGAATATTTSYVIGVGILIYLLRKMFAIKFDVSWYTKMAMLVGMSVTLFYGLSFLNHYLSATISLLLYTIVAIKYLLTNEDRTHFVSIAKHVLHGDFIKI